MRAEVITIGTELLHGYVTNRNFETIARELSRVGVEVVFHTTVGDDSERMADSFRAAVHRADVVVATGGLGPTPDDITRKTIATVFRRRLVLDETVLDQIRGRFRSRGIEMPALNESQALIPRGARVIENLRGTAPGLHFSHQDTEIFVLPGVASEAEQMLTQYVVPCLKAHPQALRIGQRVVRTIGLPESAVAERLLGFEAEEPEVRLAYLPHTSGVALTLTAASRDAAVVQALLGRAEARVVERLGSHVYGGEADTLSAVVGRLLSERGLTLATAESLSGGSIGAAVTATPGSSRYFLGGVVAYADDAKEALLGVDGRTLRRHGAVSAEVAERMAAGARSRLSADIGLSATGIAGPEGGTAEKPVGLVFLGLATEEGVRTSRHVFGGSRGEVVARTASYALDLVRRHLLSEASWSGPSSHS
jgi:nicotinamide-nucleotide amidase